MASLRVLILESDPTGHRLQFVRGCVQAIADLDVEIIFATGSSTPGTDEFRTHIVPVLDRITIDASFAANANSPLRAAATRAAQFAAAIERHHPDHVYIPYADGLAQVSGVQRLLGRRRPQSTECEGILMRGRFAYPGSSWRDPLFARAWLVATSRSPLDIVHFLDPIPYQRLLERGGSLAARARLVPEPVETATPLERREARRALDLPLEGRVVGCLGSLDQRKGVDRLVRAFASAATRLRPDDRLLLVGRVSASVRATIHEARDLVDRGRILLREGVASDAAFQQAMAASDVVAATYPRHIGSSGIVVRAAALERMVLSSDFGWLGMVTRRFNLGLTCDCREDGPIGRLLPAVLEASESFRPSPAARRFTRFHTQSNFSFHLARRLRERLDVDAVEQGVTWDWVLQAASPDEPFARQPPRSETTVPAV